MTEINPDIWVMTNLFSMLVAPSLDGNSLEPTLATKWEWSSGGTTLTLDLCQSVKAADGSPFSAEDVKFTVDRARNPEIGEWNSLLASVEAVDIPGPHKVALKLKRPDPDPGLLPALGMFFTCILPKATIMATPGADVEEKIKAFTPKPIGTGPFVISEWSRDQVMRLKRNPTYWKKGDDGQPLPYLDEIEFQITKDDSTRPLKLKADEIHGTELIPYARVAERKTDPNMRVELWPATKTVIKIMNCRPTLKGGAKNPLIDVRVHQALNYAVNKQALI